MSAEFKCPHCGASSKFPNSQDGMIHCEHCDKWFPENPVASERTTASTLLSSPKKSDQLQGTAQGLFGTAVFFVVIGAVIVVIAIVMATAAADSPNSNWLIATACAGGCFSLAFL